MKLTITDLIRREGRWIGGVDPQRAIKRYLDALADYMARLIYPGSTRWFSFKLGEKT